MRSSFSESKLNLDLEKYSIDSNALSKLDLNNQRIIDGSEDIVTTPIIKRISVDELIADWTKVFNANKDLMNDVLVEMEEKQKGKISARSRAKPWSENKSTLYNYFNRKQPSYVYHPKLNKSGPLRPADLESTLKLLKNGTSAGLPSMLKKGVEKYKFNQDYLEKQLSADYPCVLFTRTQESWKTRYVWGYPMANALYEMLVYKPLQAVQKKLAWRSALTGPNATDEAITRMINFAVRNDLTLMSVDFSAYDASVSENEVDNAFNYIKSHFQIKYHNKIDEMCKFFKTCGITSPDGIISGLHGIPSGSVFTNEVGSIVQYQLYEDTGLVYMDWIQCQGDDGALVLSDASVDELITRLPKYGKVTEKSKCSIAKDWIVFLQNLYHIDYMKEGKIGGIYPTYRALCRLMYQERWSDFENYKINGDDYYSIRAIQILENCKFHPLFEEFVKFVYSKDKYKLAYSDEGLSKMIKMINEKQGKSGIVDNQYGDNLKGLANFETVKILKSLNN